MNNYYKILVSDKNIWKEKIFILIIIKKYDNLFALKNIKSVQINIIIFYIKINYSRGQKFSK